MDPFNSRLKKSREVLRSIAAALVLALVLQDAAFAVGSSPSQPVRIPQELGEIREQADLRSDKLIINIQDAHAQLGAQESIARILDDLVKRYDLKLVSLEGASSYVDTSLVSSYPDADVRRKTGEALLKSGQISAGEFYSMVSEKRVLLYGVEDKALYEDNLGAFRELADKRPAVKAELKKLRTVVAALESVLYPKDLRDFLDAKRRFRRSPKGFSEYWKECRRLADTLGLDFKEYPDLVQLNDVLALESGIEFKKASEERDMLIAELSRLLPKGSLDQLILLALDYKKGKISDVRFHRSLLGLARGLSLSLRGYPNLDRFVGYLERYERVDFVGLLGELERFETQIRKGLETTPYSQRLSRLSERARLLTALLDVSLENTDYEKYLSLNGNRPLEPLRWELEELCRVSGKNSFAKIDYKALSDSLPSALRFYEYASKRNQALLTNTLKRMEKEHVHVAALITGGFHSEGIAKLLHSEQVSYLVVMPKFDDKTGERPYITILTQKPKEYEAMFKDSDMYIAPPVMLDTAAAGARLAEGPEVWKEVLVRVLAEAYIKEGALSPLRKAEYLKAYVEQAKGATDQIVSPKTLERVLHSLQIEKDAAGLTFTVYGEGFFFPSFEVFSVPVNGDRVGAIERTQNWDLVQAGARLCGNFGFIAEKTRDDKNLLPKRFGALVRLMGKQTEIRGEQAGGGLLFGQKGGNIHLIGEKVVNSKRDNLTRSLGKRLVSRLRRAESRGFKTMDSVIKGIWHYRYGTSSAPAIIETHYHEWTPATKKDVWHFDGTRWNKKRENVHHVITHNGDFDDWRIFGERVGNLQLGFWLERVLGVQNDTKGDSPKIAGMMDLLITQGMWDSSTRLAYQWAVARSSEDASDHKPLFEMVRGVPRRTKSRNTAPSPKQLAEWASFFEQAFETVLKKNPAHLEEELVREVQSRRIPFRIPEERQEAFIRFAVHFFLHNDPNHATKIFLSRAGGSFGLVVASSMDEERLVVAAKGQPISLGYNRKERLAVYASEPAAVNSVLLAKHPESSYRLDLDSGSGEVALMGPDEVSIYSMEENRDLTDKDLADRWIPMHDNPYIHAVPVDSSKDPVGNDISEIPEVLSQIRADWSDPDSFNRQSSSYFEDLLVEMARRSESRPAGLVSKKVDILITGIENSLWLGEQFAQDMGSAFPGLNIQSTSANKIIENPGELPVGPDTIVLYISQSGQTFASLQGTALLENFNDASSTLKKNGIRELFIMTGELDSLMGAAIGQKYQPDAPFSRRIFVNGSGRRTAEPSTVAAAAAEQTLTELFLRLTRRLREDFPSGEPLGLALTQNDLGALEARKNDFIDKSAPYITGTDSRGIKISSPENKHFILSGKKWADHITEGAVGWFFSALYVVGSLLLSAFTHGTPVVSLVTFAAGGPLAIPILIALLLVDAALYIWMPWFVILIKRSLDGRNLFARRGKRTIVIGDVPNVHQPLEQYVSKLMSLSFGDASVDVHGANPQDHMLHRFGHRVVRGTLIWLGVPDGRRSKVLGHKASAVLMTGSQAKGVANFGVSAEVTVVGTDPGIAQKSFDDTILLHSEAKIPGPRPDHPELVEKITESRFTSFQRLLGGYVYFWAMAQKVASLPFLRYEFWKSQSRTRIATTASPSAVAAVEFQGDSAPWNGPGERKFTLVSGRSAGARLAQNAKSPARTWIRAGLFIFTLIGWLMNPFSRAAAATVKGVAGHVMTFTTNNAAHGDWLWRIARHMLGKSASNQQVADRVRELASQNGITNPNVLSASHDYTYSGPDVTQTAQNMGWTPPHVDTPPPALQPDLGTADLGTHSVDQPFNLGHYLSEHASNFFHHSLDWMPHVPGADAVLVPALIVLGVVVIIAAGYVLWKKWPKSRRADRTLLENSARPEINLPPRVRQRSSVPIVQDLPDTLDRPADRRTDTASGPPLVRRTSSAPLFMTQPGFDEPDTFAAAGARLAGAAGGGPPPDKNKSAQASARLSEETFRPSLVVGVVLAPGQDRASFEKYASDLLGDKAGRFRFTYENQLTAATIEKLNASGVRLILDQPDLEVNTADPGRALFELLAKTDDETFRKFFPLLAQLTDVSVHELNELEERQALSTLAAVLPPAQIKGAPTGISLAFTLADPSYQTDLSPLAPLAIGSKPKTIVTDLDVFTKDADGTPYAMRMRHLQKKAPGAFDFALLVRDPSLKDRNDVIDRYPEAAVFSENKMLFAPDALTVRDLRALAPRFFDENTSIIMPEPGKLVPDTEVKDKKTLLVSLDPQADSSIGILEADALLLQNDKLILAGLSKMADGSWWYLPPVVPIGYRLLIEALTGRKMTLRSA